MSNQQPMKENKMGTMPVNRLLLSMSLPIMLSMLVQAFYNVVDGYFVAKIGENALTAISLSFPIQNLIIAVAVGTGVGINSFVSRKLGEKHFEDANAGAENGLFLAAISGLVFAVFGLFFTRPFFELFTQDEQIITYGVQYLSICSIWSMGSLVEISTERILQSTGKTVFTMLAQGCGAITNIILDPILIFGLGPFPEMGIRGAAVATVIGQFLAMILALWFHFRYNTEIKISVRKFRPNARIIREIYAVGVPSIFVQSIGSVMTVALNKILIFYSATAVSVLGAYIRMQSFVFMPVFGLCNGLVPIVAYNFGARKKPRIMLAIRDALIYAIVIMTAGLLVFQLFPAQMLGLFNASEEMLAIGVPALRIVSFSFLGAAVGITLSSVFQAIGNGIFSLIMSVSRQLLLILPSAWIFGKIWGLSAIWYVFPLAEVVGFVLILFLYRYTYRKNLAPLDDAVEQT